MWRFGWNPKRVLRGTDKEALLVPAGYGTDPLTRAGCESVRQGDLRAGLTLLEDTALSVREVDPAVGKVGNDGPQLLEPPQRLL